MPDCKALEIAPDEDLKAFSRYLWTHGFPHRITEQSDRLVVWVPEAELVPVLREVYARWQRGDPLPAAPERSGPRPVGLTRRVFDARREPLTLILVALSVLGYLAVVFDPVLDIAHWLTFYNFDFAAGHLRLTLEAHQYWRLITPIFLHFSLLHIAFNMLWLWDLGGRIERVQGTWRLLGLVLLLGAGSDIAQAVFAARSLFGGMSGVIYGLLGYSWAWSALRRDRVLHVPNAVVAVMVGWLLLCMVGFTELLGQGAVANAAHVAGLVLGLLLGGGAAALAGRRQADDV